MIYDDTRDAMKAHLQLVSTPRSRDRNLLTPPSDSQGLCYFFRSRQPQDRHRRRCKAPDLLIYILATNISTGPFCPQENRSPHIRLRKRLPPIGRTQPQKAQGLNAVTRSLSCLRSVIERFSTMRLCKGFLAQDDLLRTGLCALLRKIGGKAYRRY